MSASGLEVFDTTIQQTNGWLKQISDAQGCERKDAYHMLRAVLQTVRDRLTVEQAAHLSAQLPMLVRGIYYEGYHPAHKPTTERHREDFLERIEARMERMPAGPDEAVTTVLSVLRDEITAGEYEKAKDAMPKDIAALWP